MSPRKWTDADKPYNYAMRRVDLDAFAEISVGLDLTVCQTPQWLEFLRASQNAEPVLAEVTDHGQKIGLFVGAIVKRGGLRILGSPLRGWTTSYMGFATAKYVQHGQLLSGLDPFAFKSLEAVHWEVLDREINRRTHTWSRSIHHQFGLPIWVSLVPVVNLVDSFLLKPSRTHVSMLHGYEIDLTRSEAELLEAMTPACRRCVRKAEKSGLAVEVVREPVGFATQYYAQLCEVFARQRLVPPYPQRRVEQLIDALHPSGMLLLLRARDSRGEVVATSIFPGYGSMMYFWGGASTTAGRGERPNEAMMWAAMRYWKALGAERFDMGGGGAYKAKYGGTPIAVPWLRASRSPAIAALRWSAEKLLRARQRLHGVLRRG